MPHSLKVALALGVVYLVWGSSYLAIRVGVQEMEPMLFCGLRFLFSAPLMFCFAIWRGERLPDSRKKWVVILTTALVMQVLSSGLIAWSQQWVPSNQAALIFCSSALWLAWFGSLGKNGDAINSYVGLSIVVGLCGIALVVYAGLTLKQVPTFAYLAIFLSAISWPFGTIILRRYTTRSESMMIASLHLLIAGITFCGVSLLLENPVDNVWSKNVLLSLAYLVLLSSFVGYGAYYWLIHAASPALLGTFAYVTPAVAVVLGAWLLEELLTVQQLIGALLTLLSVLAVIIFGSKPTQDKTLQRKSVLPS